jgi:hypothetical protein
MLANGPSDMIQIPDDWRIRIPSLACILVEAMSRQGGASMRYINRKDERLLVREATCTCGHTPEEHEDEVGACQARDQRSGDSCECSAFEPEEESS